MAHKSSGTGIVLILVGSALLLANLEVIRFRHLLEYWPAALIALGVWFVIRDRRNRRTSPEPPDGPPPPP